MKHFHKNLTICEEETFLSISRPDIYIYIYVCVCVCCIPMIYASQWTNETLLYKNISFYSLKNPQFVISWEIDGKTYTQREDFFLFHIFFREPGGANACTPLQAVLSDGLMPLIGCVSLAWLPILCTLSKSDRMVIMWSPSGYTPVVPDCPDMLSSPCLLITAWQPVKALGITRNELKIHVICYITYIYIYIYIYIKMEFLRNCGCVGTIV